MLHSSVLLHQPFGRSVGNVEDILSQVMQIRETTQAIERSYLKNSRESETLTALAR
jgi:ATP-dependent protease ClpP protease subunit